MNRLTLTTLVFVFHCVSAQDRLRKISGDAAPEKAQEPIIDNLDDFIPTIDSSVQLDHIPVPPILIVSHPIPPEDTALPPQPASVPTAPAHLAEPAPPSLKPSDVSGSTLSPLSSDSTSTTLLFSEDGPTTTFPYDGIQITVDINDILPEPTDDLEEFQKADVLESETNDEIKDLVKKTTINTTDDYYITSPATTVTSPLQSDTIEENNVFNFDTLFAKKIVVKESASTVQVTDEDSSTTSMTSTTTIAPATTTTSTTSSTTTTTTSVPTTTKHDEATTEYVHKKTCIHVNELKKVDDSVNLKPGTKKGTIEVSVELGDEEDEETSDDAPEEEETEAPVRQVRENKKPVVVWKKFEMNCDEEEDEKGKICKLWAAGGLCGTHKPTMFLFCRRTCLCVGPN